MTISSKIAYANKIVMARVASMISSNRIPEALAYRAAFDTARVAMFERHNAEADSLADTFLNNTNNLFVDARAESNKSANKRAKVARSMAEHWHTNPERKERQGQILRAARANKSEGV